MPLERTNSLKFTLIIVTINKSYQFHVCKSFKNQFKKRLSENKQNASSERLRFVREFFFDMLKLSLWHENFSHFIFCFIDTFSGIVENLI